MQTHKPVLLQESIDALKIKASGIYVDGTFGRGGHAQAILDLMGPEGRFFAFDKDQEAVAYAQSHFAQDARFHIEQGSFTQLASTLNAQHCAGQVDGILLDLGVSSPQLDVAERGFSFAKRGQLDMRMDLESPLTAQKWLHQASVDEMAKVFKEYGEERFAKRIANAIEAARKIHVIEDTLMLAEIVARAHPAWEKHKHPATRVFQAIRIRVNRELEDLQQFLMQALDNLAVGGRLVIISFHSLEDRLVKQFIRTHSTVDHGPEGLPIQTQQAPTRLKKIGKLIVPENVESKENPRARSARLRIAEKLS